MDDARKERENSGPHAVAVRVCTDCHFSLQTVTVATSLQAKSRGGASNGGRTRAGDGIAGVIDGVAFDDDDDESLLRRLGDGSGSARGAKGSPLLRGPVDENGDFSGGWGFVEKLEAVYAAEDIAGDLTLEDVLEWDRIQVSRRFQDRDMEHSSGDCLQLFATRSGCWLVSPLGRRWDCHGRRLRLCCVCVMIPFLLDRSTPCGESFVVLTRGYSGGRSTLEFFLSFFFFRSPPFRRFYREKRVQHSAFL